jgi:hypothetical protein
MAATETVPQHFQHCKFAPILPRHGVITLFGYGITVTVDRGHLTIQDGIGLDRREARHGTSPATSKRFICLLTITNTRRRE